MDVNSDGAATSNTALGAGAEFDAIRALLTEWGDVARGVGDDAAVLDVTMGEQLVVSTDATVEDVHFRRKWISVHDAGARAATAALSDLAAMGAVPTSVLVSLIVPAVWRDHLVEFAAGLKQSIKRAGAHIVGGNISRGGTFSCTLTVIGRADRPVLRNGARVGDVLFVTGMLGGPGAAVAAWQRNEIPAGWAIERFSRPVARLAEGRWLAKSGASAMIDVSDGLAADSGHLGAASGVVCVLERERIPFWDGTTAEAALASGEEYELLVAFPSSVAAEVEAAFRAEFGAPLTRVGYITAPSSPGDSTTRISSTSESASRVELPAGHDHLSS